ncbi:MAG: malic enzyme-like NAD(P)-binding protein, partial [Candidatus Micrarchaeota archaeon]
KPHDLALAYTPGVASSCRAITQDPSQVWALTGKRNRAAIITDGTRVLGLGDIGPLAALPVMEGKALLMNALGGVDAIPLCLDEKDEKKFIDTVSRLAPSFGAILLEDISSPKCFRIERTLAAVLPIPVFHDDQHGTAVVVLAGLLGALKLTGRDEPSNVRIVVCGAGAAGNAIATLLHAYGFTRISVMDSHGALTPARTGLDEFRAELASWTENTGHSNLEDVLAGADVFIGVSAPNLLDGAHVRSMAKDPIIFALSNPDPEIKREAALAAGAAVYGSARSDWPNQVNNLLAFPGIFRGLLDAGATSVSQKMKIAAALAIAKIAEEDGLSKDKVIPNPLDARVHRAVAAAIIRAAKEEGLVRKKD